MELTQVVAAISIGEREVLGRLFELHQPRSFENVASFESHLAVIGLGEFSLNKFLAQLCSHGYQYTQDFGVASVGVIVHGTVQGTVVLETPGIPQWNNHDLRADLRGASFYSSWRSAALAVQQLGLNEIVLPWDQRLLRAYAIGAEAWVPQ